MSNAARPTAPQTATTAHQTYRGTASVTCRSRRWGSRSTFSNFGTAA